MTILSCLHTESKCWRVHEEAHPIGIVVHSTGVNQPRLARYVQPSSDDQNREELLSLLGVNRNGNHWNREVDKAVHYMIGLLQDGSAAIAQTLPEDICAWGVGSGKKGSYNYDPTAHIQFEICEDDLSDRSYFLTCYALAVSLCADICRRHGWKESVILSHKEAYRKGYASNHGDIDHWLKRYGLTMNDFRADVRRLLEPEQTFSVGELVDFIGDTHYTNANAKTGKPCRPGKAEVKQIYRLGESRHPYLIKAVSGGGSNVYGWVNENDIKRLD